jgi:hypothetical protein
MMTEDNFLKLETDLDFKQSCFVCFFLPASLTEFFTPRVQTGHLAHVPPPSKALLEKVKGFHQVPVTHACNPSDLGG